MEQRRGRGERGATLVESALITPVLMLFVFAIFEFGFAFRDYLGVSNVVRDGAREASVASNSADADYRILRTIRRAGAALPDNAINRVIIFEAADAESTPSAGCLAGTSSSTPGARCNVYSPSDFTLDVTQFGCDPGPPVEIDTPFCPRDRSVTVGTLTYVGVWVQIDHDYITGLFGTTVTFTDQIILKVEPQETP